MALAIRLAARTLEPFHLESPEFLTFLCPLDTLWRNFRKLMCRGVAAVIFRTRGHEKLGIRTFLFLFKMAEICRGVHFEQLLAIKV